jgi:hemerythrin-like domain-containing protein
VERGVRLYAERLRHNMAVEELTLFPTAESVLGEADWRTIEAAMPQVVPDPLFHTPVEARFADLLRVIGEEAG